MSLKSKFKRTLSGLLSMAIVTTIVPYFPVSAEDSEKYPYTMFASSNEDGAITVNAYNFTINGQIATNGTVNCNGNTNINYESSNNICVDMVYIPNKIDKDFFDGKKVDCVEDDYSIEDTNIDISTPLSVDGTTTMQGNVTIEAGVKSKDDICISGDVKNSYNTVIYSQYGDIIIDCNNVSLNGLIYAPFGTIHITATNLNMNDTMIIANKIVIDAPNVNVNYSEHFGSYFNEVSDKMEIMEDDFGYLKDLNGDGIPDFFENSINWKYIDDTDGDGVPNIIEINTGTDPNTPDSDLKDIVDGITLEMMYKNPLVILDSETSKPRVYGDMNNDTVLDAFDLVLMRQLYLNNGYDKYADLDADGDLDVDDLAWLENYLLLRVKSFPVYDNFDSDGDGLSNYIEVQFTETSPNNADTDGDGLSDYIEVMHTRTDPKERESVEKGTSDADIDSDEDGISNIDEIRLGTSPSSDDTDMDNLNDGYEVNILKTNPIKADTDDDGLDDYEETQLGLNPLKPATDGTPDGERIIKQVIPADDPVFRNINTSDNAYTLSVEIEASGYAKNHLMVRDSSYAYALQDSSAVGFTPEFIYDDSYKVKSITLNFEIKEEFRDNVSHYFDSSNLGDDYYDYTYSVNSELDGIKRFNVFKYFQNISLPMPICTEYDVDNNIVSVTIDTFETDDDGNSYGIGSYSLVDLEVWGTLMNEPDDTSSNTFINTRSASSNGTITKRVKKIDDSVANFISRNYQSYVARKAVKTGENLDTGTTSISSLFGHRYAYYEAKGIRYEDAAAACRKKGGHLLTVTSPFEYSYLSGTLSSGKSGLYWVGASGGPDNWSWVTHESTSYARSIKVGKYSMDNCGSYFGNLGNHLAYCPGLAYLNYKNPGKSDIKGYICEWEPGAKITDEASGIYSASIAGSTVVILKAALSASSDIDSDDDGVSDWDEIDHDAIKRLGGKDSDVSVKWKNAQNYINNIQKLAGKKTEALVKKIALVHSDDDKEVTPPATNPGDDDSDGDGYKDKFDPRPNDNDIIVTKLSNDYIMVDYSTANDSDRENVVWENETAQSDMKQISYGGAQRWFRGLKNDIPDKEKREYLADQGCGLIALADLALYLARRDPNTFGTGITKIANVVNPIDFNKYKEYILDFEKSYVDLHSPELNIPVLKPIAGPGLSTIHVPGYSIDIPYGNWFDINSNDGNMGKLLTDYFEYNDINYKAKWCFFDTDLETINIWAKRIKNLISKDIPAIIAIGPDIGNNDKVPLYSRTNNDIYKKAVYKQCNSVDSHYFNVTAIIEDKVRADINHFDSVMYEVSSWGSKYYMSEKEMDDFIGKNSSLFTNLVYIEEK